MEQNCVGLINGIKFGISFMLNRGLDLAAEELKVESASATFAGGVHD